MVHFDFFCFEGSFRGFSTALHLDVSKCPVVTQEINRNLPDCLVEDLFQTELCQGGALNVLPRVDLLTQLQTLCICYGRHLLLGQLLDRSLVLSQVALGADKNDRDARCMVVNFWVPL